jgi:hypothetical protein
MRCLSQLKKTITAAVLFLPPLVAMAANPVSSGYFALGPELVLEYRGTYEFSYKRVEFTQSTSTDYLIRSTGDQSPSQDKLVSRGDYIYWVLGSSGENWLKIKTTLHKGDRWQHHVRGWSQTYRVATTDLTVNVPAGEFKHCAKVTVSWVANEHDMKGPQKIELYLAPSLGIVKRIVYSDGSIEHEEVAISHNSGSVG